jgi:hypothetical protein
MTDTAPPAEPPAEPLGLDAVTEADIRRTLRGVAGHNAGAVRRRIREGAEKELARLEQEAGRLRAWLGMTAARDAR